MPTGDPTIVIAPLIQLGATYFTRELPTGRPVIWGVQCRDTAVTDEHLELLARCEQVRAVGLDGTRITNRCLPALANLRFLESLDLNHTTVDDAGLDLLQEARQLEFLHVGQTRVTESGVRKLQQRLRKCEIVSRWT